MAEIRLVQGTQEWHEWRKCRVTATDTAKVLRGDRYAITPNEVWRAKNENRFANPAMNFGTAIEPFARKYAERTLNRKFQPACWTHDTFDWLVASLDGISVDDTVQGPCLLEIKAGGADRRTIESTGNPATYVWYQIQHQLLVTGLKEAVLLSHPCLPDDRDDRNSAILEVGLLGGAVPNPSYPPRLLTIAADPLAQETIMRVAKEIWALYT